MNKDMKKARKMLDDLRALFEELGGKSYNYKVGTAESRRDADRAKKALWDVLTGLRGPDAGDPYNDEIVKFHTTGVIRGIVFGEGGFTVPALVNHSGVIDLTRYDKTTPPHFTSHVVAAMHALHDLGYDVKVVRNKDESPEDVV